jgi:hypothetical protein
MINEQVLAGKRRRTPAEIEQIVGEFASSGLNRTQFCRQQGLRWGVLNRQLRRMQAASSDEASGNALVAVELAGQKLDTAQAGCGLAVELARGRRITVGVGFDRVTLQRLVQVLETM